MAGKSLIYVNFSPYDNTGRTLDFLIKEYSFVAHFSFDHLRLKNNRRAQLTFYVNGGKKGIINLLWLRTYSFLLFPSLPFVALAMFFETLWYTFLVTRQTGKIDSYITVNAYPAATGVILQKIGLVRRTIFWIWDFYPPNYPDWRLRLVRRVYLIFDSFAIKYSSKIVFLNEFLKKSRISKGHHNNQKKSEIIPIGTSPSTNINQMKKNIIGHMGLLKESQGLDLILNNLDEFFKKFPNVIIEIVGSGPEQDRYKNIASLYPEKVIYKGFIEKHSEIEALIKRWKIGLATYVPTPWSEHYWGDPSKIKAYLACGTPVITTDVPEFSKEVKESGSGEVINYDKNELFDAIEKILRSNKKYSKNALNLSKKYYYNKIYPNLLS